MLIKSKVADALPELIERVGILEIKVEELEKVKNQKNYEENTNQQIIQVKKTTKKENK